MPEMVRSDHTISSLGMGPGGQQVDQTIRSQRNPRHSPLSDRLDSIDHGRVAILDDRQHAVQHSVTEFPRQRFSLRQILLEHPLSPRIVQ